MILLKKLLRRVEKRLMLAQILVSFIIIIVGVNLVPSVADTVAAANGGNVTGASSSLLSLVPLFFIIGILVTTIQSSIAVLARMGL